MPEIEFETTLNQDQRIVVNADVDLPCNRYTNDPDSDLGDVEIVSVLRFLPKFLMIAPMPFVIIVI